MADRRRSVHGSSNLDTWRCRRPRLRPHRTRHPRDAPARDPRKAARWTRGFTHINRPYTPTMPKIPRLSVRKGRNSPPNPRTRAWTGPQPRTARTDYGPGLGFYGRTAYGARGTRPSRAGTRGGKRGNAGRTRSQTAKPRRPVAARARPRPTCESFRERSRPRGVGSWPSAHRSMPILYESFSLDRHVRSRGMRHVNDRKLL